MTKESSNHFGFSTSDDEAQYGSNYFSANGESDFNDEQVDPFDVTVPEAPRVDTTNSQTPASALNKEAVLSDTPPEAQVVQVGSATDKGHPEPLAKRNGNPDNDDNRMDQEQPIIEEAGSGGTSIFQDEMSSRRDVMISPAVSASSNNNLLVDDSLMGDSTLKDYSMMEDRTLIDHSGSQNNTNPTDLRSNSRKRRNSLALRKQTIPVHFSFAGMTASSMNSSDLYDMTTADVDAFTATDSRGGGIHDESSSVLNGDHKQRGMGGKSGGSSITSAGEKRRRRKRLGFLRSTCLNPRFSLQTQMMLSFGFVSVIVISTVMAICIIVTVLSGQNVNSITSDTFENLAMEIEGTTVRFISEFLTYRLMPTTIVRILHESVRDRMAGYPDAPGFAEDTTVPFMDSISQANRYPVVGSPLPLDWEVSKHANVNEYTYWEHVQDRWNWYQVNSGPSSVRASSLSTETSGYFMQGMCDPSINDPTHPYFFPGCTEANNDLRTGGVVAPTDINELLHRKASDLSPVFKALYEYQQDIKSIAVAFANRGAGSTVQFPLHSLDSQATYMSQGCDWMQQPNPYKSHETIAGVSDATLASGCRPAGTTVSYRTYNPMEQDWCRKQALQPDLVHIDGPHLDYASWHGVGEYRWMLTIGQAMYDRLTYDFIGCIRVDIVLDFLEEVLAEALVTENSHITIVRSDKHGTVVSTSERDMKQENQTMTIDQLDIGFSKKDYMRLRRLVDYDNEVWNSTELRVRYESFIVSSKDGYLVGAYPMPPPPAEYDSHYRPHFFAIKSVSRDDVFMRLSASRGTVEENVDALVNLTLLIGAVGLCIVLLIIALVSNRLTAPLRFMNDVASNIVNNYVDNNEDGIDYSQSEKYQSRCVPRTEISEVVDEFQKMVERFSGTSNAKAMRVNHTEVMNRFQMFADFGDLYASRDEGAFNEYRLSDCSSLKEQSDEPASSGASPGAKATIPTRMHYGTVLRPETDLPSTIMQRQPSDDTIDEISDKRKWFLSPLFCGIVMLIATPLVLTTIALTTIVTFNISREFPDLVEGAKEDYLSIELFALTIYVHLRANLVSAATSRHTRDLNLLTRYSSWLLFGGVERADTFTEVAAGAEECKWYADRSECPFMKERPCDCTWNEQGEECQLYDIDSRYLQKLLYAGESLDTLRDGDRNSTSYPAVAYSQNTTAWWHDVSELPGAEKGSSASGHDTTYDRWRVLSALPVTQPLYNYDEQKSHVEGTYVAMEEDGLFMGYYGCGSAFTFVTTWKSSESNGGADTRPELCPLGKYGYDPRCRGWYHDGRRLYLENKTAFYLTPPYATASNEEEYTQSATGTIVDPVTKKHVGQTLVDFVSTEAFVALKRENTPLCEVGFPILITPNRLGFKGDTVIGPGYASTGDPPRVEELVLPYGDDECEHSDCVGWERFKDIVLDMKRGGKAAKMFGRKAEDGSDERMFIAYAPVTVKRLDPNDSSFFSRGVDSMDHLIYSLGMVTNVESLLEPFEAIEDKMHQQRNIAIVVLSVVILLSAFIVVYISSIVAASVAKPMVYLVDLIRHINRLSVDAVTASLGPDKDYGCREVRNVANTMEALHKVVRDANVAFFSGDIETAYAVLTDTLRLFQRLDNKKAIGVSNNNLGNCMLAMFRRMQKTREEKICDYTQKEIVQKGLAYFHKAIKLGEAAYDEFYEREGWSPSCLEFMQHLSNRYFNRAMFLLTVKNTHKNPKELEELGCRDLQIVRDMDVEIVDEGTQVGWNVRTVDQLFDVKLSRIKGHLELLDMGYADDWDLEELLDDAVKIVMQEMMNQEASKLFVELSPVGRMQQVETELMRYLVYKQDLSNAARVAIRMLLEDEFTLPYAQTKAVEVIIEYVRSQDPDKFRRKLKPELIDYQAWLHQMDEENDHRVSSGRDAPDFHERSEVFQLSTQRLSSASGNTDRNYRRSSLQESQRGDFTMEVF